MAEIKTSMTMLNVEAYALSSDSFVLNDSHCYVVSADRLTCWKNHGRGWSEGKPGERVVSAQVYKEWLDDFMPASGLNYEDRCGMSFGYNGVCHTYANRELLLADTDVCVASAPKDFVCVAMFGKYGLGITQLKNRLRVSYERVSAQFALDEDAYHKVIARIDDAFEDEFNAWSQVCKEYCDIPVDSILAKSPEAGRAIAREKLKAFLNVREALYQQYASGTITAADYRNKRATIIVESLSSYMDWLEGIGFITAANCATYKENATQFIYRLEHGVVQQMAHITQTGTIHMTLAAEDE